jgi:glycosyltransferase involved in cell wall biosynthesis
MSKSAEGRVAQQEGEGPVVSVIVIFLDPGTFLNEAIESIRRQTFAHWEVVLVDDGSTDGSSGFARALCEQDPVRFRYLDHPGHENRGTSASRNAGLAAARGRYVAFLDADDVYLPTRLEAHVGILDSMPDIDMVQSDHLWWTSWQDERDQIDEDHMRPFAWAEDCIVSPPEALMTILAAPLSSTMPCSITVRRSTALAVGGFEACIHSLYEDQAFLTKIYIDKPIYAMNACLAKHRVHAASLMNSVAATAFRKTGIWQRDSRALSDWQKRYIGQFGNQHPVLDAQMRQRERGLKRLPFRGFVAMLRGRTRAFLRAALPSSAYLSIMRRRRRSLDRRTRQQLKNLRDMLGRLKIPAESDQMPSDREHAKYNDGYPK